ncbi:MAG: sulfoxide reductase heme-binding subunit YedZ [Chloroflexi bacterium]|nr:sulfoxide reductase heme-binding subunit YedZ [Chloroflexota bacterium]
MLRGGSLPWLKPGIFIGALAPLVVMVLEAIQGTMGPNPIAEIENVLGLAALVLLLASLACTPARHVFGWTWPARVRRLLGLYAFFYVGLHFLVYVLVDQSLDAGRIVEDIVKRPFITVGFAALVLLIPLALTSTTASIRRLGFKRWTLLHQLAYVAGVLAVIHFFWRVKIDVNQPLIYAGILAALLVIRVVFWLRRRPTPRLSSSAARR